MLELNLNQTQTVLSELIGLPLTKYWYWHTIFNVVLFNFVVKMSKLTFWILQHVLHDGTDCVDGGLSVLSGSHFHIVVPVDRA